MELDTENGLKRPKLRGAGGGFAAIETAGFVVIMLVFVLAAAGLVNYVQKVMLFSHAVDKYVFDQNIKPLALSAGGTWEISEGRLREKLPSLLEALKADLEEALPGDDFTPDRYLLQADFAAIDIDPQSGAGRGLITFAGSLFSLGSLQVPGEILERADLQRQFQNLADLPGVPHPLAVPSGGFNVSGADQFVKATVLLGLRAFYTLEGTFTGNIVSQLGISSGGMVFDYKVVTLRGEAE